MDRLRVLLLVLLVAGAGLAAWLLSAPGENRPTAPEAGELSATEVDPGRSLTGQPLAGVPRSGSESSDVAPGGASSAAEGQAKASPGAEQPEQASAEITEPVLTPIYGPAVQRGGAMAGFSLVDAKDQPLIVDDVSLELWRRVGMRWISEAVRWAPESRTIWCRGSGDAGLEPGEYELEVRSKVYGAFRHTFRVNKGERLESTLRFETWRRIVCFEFRKVDGKPVDWIRNAPTVAAAAPGLEALERASEPADILREPPPRPMMGGGGGRGGRGGFAYRRARGGGGYAPYKTATDGGRYYVPVIAGIENTVIFGFAEEWGTDKLQFVNLFTGQEWDSYPVTLELVHDFDQLTAEWKELGTDDPGARSLLSWVERRLNPPAIDDPAAVSGCRLVLELEAPAGVIPMYAVGTPEAVPALTKRMTLRQGLYYADAAAGQTIRFGFHYLEKQVSEPESHTFSEDTGQRVQRIKRKMDARMVATPMWEFTPTLEACLLEKVLGIPVTRKDELDYWKLDLSRPEYPVFEALRALLRDEECAQEVRLDWRFYGDTSDTNSWEMEYRDTGDVADALDRGDLHPPKLTGLVLRAIGPEQEGLPWVEASVVDYEQDERARRLRDVETTLAAEGKRPKLGARFGLAFYSETQAEQADAEFMRNHVGEEFLKLTSQPEDLDYYARCGAWYNTHRRLKSDAKGYLFSGAMRLVEGRVYVLYLWSNSRDDLKPDARVVFRATEGVTDLGAILLPTYTR